MNVEMQRMACDGGALPWNKRPQRLTGCHGGLWGRQAWAQASGTVGTVATACLLRVLTQQLPWIFFFFFKPLAKHWCFPLFSWKVLQSKTAVDRMTGEGSGRLPGGLKYFGEDHPPHTQGPRTIIRLICAHLRAKYIICEKSNTMSALHSVHPKYVYFTAALERKIYL